MIKKKTLTILMMSVFVFSAQDTFAQSKKKRKADKDAPVKVKKKNR
jgi:hypothetical protein